LPFFGHSLIHRIGPPQPWSPLLCFQVELFNPPFRFPPCFQGLPTHRAPTGLPPPAFLQKSPTEILVRGNLPRFFPPPHQPFVVFIFFPPAAFQSRCCFLCPLTPLGTLRARFPSPLSSPHHIHCPPLSHSPQVPLGGW